MDENNNEKKQKKRKVPKAFDIIVPIICVAVIACAGYNLYNIYHSYSEAQNIYDGLSLMVNDGSDTEDQSTAAAKKTMEEAGFPYLDIDYDGLYEINSDFLGWLYFPLLDISYPVVYGDEDFTYLKKAMDGTPSNSGTLFIDCMSDPNINDMTTIIYGHNMRNGSMFGSLKKIRQESGLIDQDPYFYYYTKEKAYKCRVFAYYLEKSDGLTYSAPENNSGYDKYLNYVLNKNEYTDGPDSVDLAHRPQIMTLSTCSGHNTGNRTVIQAAIVDTYEFTE